MIMSSTQEELKEMNKIVESILKNTPEKPSEIDVGYSTYSSAHSSMYSCGCSTYPRVIITWK